MYIAITRDTEQFSSYITEMPYNCIQICIYDKKLQDLTKIFLQKEKYKELEQAIKDFKTKTRG